MTATATFLHAKQPHHCGACGSVLSGRWESLSAGLAQTLIRFYQTVDRSGKNDVHVLKECGLTINAANNFQKLRYFGLVAKVEGKSGHWLITRRGEAFVRNEIRVSKRVFVFRNAIQDRSTETVSIEEAAGDNWPFWHGRRDYVTAPELHELRQVDLF